MRRWRGRGGRNSSLVPRLSVWGLEEVLHLSAICALTYGVEVKSSLLNTAITQIKARSTLLHETDIRRPCIIYDMGKHWL